MPDSLGALLLPGNSVIYWVLDNNFLDLVVGMNCFVIASGWHLRWDKTRRISTLMTGLKSLVGEDEEGEEWREKM